MRHITVRKMALGFLCVSEILSRKKGETYQLNSEDVPVLCVVFIVSICHQLVVLQNGDPIFVVFHFLSLVGGA